LLPTISEVVDSARQGITANDKRLRKDVEPHLLTEHETHVLAEVLHVLKPASDATQSLSADRRSTISREYAEVHQMINSADELATPEAKEFRDMLQAQMTERWDFDDVRDEELIATFLNPAFAAHEMFQHPCPDDRKTATLRLNAAAWGRRFDYEIDEYEFLTSELGVDELNACKVKLEEFWNLRKNHIPGLSLLASHYQASSAASERLFSLVGRILTEDRTNLAPPTFQ
ncbi:hypothetical protein BGX28_001376, partial [Mortierella sp. GBA30]